MNHFFHRSGWHYDCKLTTSACSQERDAQTTVTDADAQYSKPNDGIPQGPAAEESADLITLERENGTGATATRSY